MDNDEITTKLRQFLMDYRLLQGHLKKLELEHKRLLSGPSEVHSVNYDEMPHSQMVRNTYRDLTRIPMCEQEIEDIKKEIQLIDDMFKAVDTGKAHNIYSKVLKGYFIEGEGVAELARDLNVSKVTISAYKKTAIYNFLVIWKGKEATKSFNKNSRYRIIYRTEGIWTDLYIKAENRNGAIDKFRAEVGDYVIKSCELDNEGED